MDLPEIQFSDYGDVTSEFYCKPGIVYFYFFDEGDIDSENLFGVLSSNLDSYERYYILRPSNHGFLIKDNPELSPTPCIFSILWGIGGYLYATARSKEELNKLFIRVRKYYESAKRIKFLPEFWEEGES